MANFSAGCDFSSASRTNLLKRYLFYDYMKSLISSLVSQTRLDILVQANTFKFQLQPGLKR